MSADEGNSWTPGKRVAVIGGGPGAVSCALAFHSRGFDVRVYEKQRECKPIGGGVLLSTPVLAILRSYGIDISNFGSPTVTHFKNKAGLERVKLPFNAEVERQMGIKGWHYGVLRSDAYKKMLDLVPEGVIHVGHEFVGYEESVHNVRVNFKNGNSIICDVLVGADGIKSAVSTQAFGPPPLFHCGLRLYLAWCDRTPALENIPENYGVISHSWNHQASFFPMLHHGKPGFEWWVVEPSWEGKPVPTDVKKHVQGILKGWADPLPRFPDETGFDTQVYRWEIYNRPSMKKWSSGRVVCVGDAVHPVSPYAAYGMGMAIEDGYFLARALEGKDLTNVDSITTGFERFEKERVDYVNGNTEFARNLGYIFHKAPWPVAKFRDAVFDWTPFLQKMMVSGNMEKSEQETLNLKELRVEGKEE